ncbi:MAG: phosphatase PAP2 family protein [Candidatus Sulfotelmatobacter sp.]
MMVPLRNFFFGLALALVMACYAIPAAAQATSGGNHSTAQMTASAKNLDPADWEPVLLESASANDVPSPQPVDSRGVRLELVQLREALQSITPHQRSLVNKWVVTNQGRVWRQVLDQLTLHNLAGAPSSLRLYAALHIAIADAEVAARNRQRAYRRPHPGELDPGIHPLVASLSPYAYPSDLAAETGAAERILLFVRPEAAGQIDALVDESMRALESSGLYLKSDCEAGRQLGYLVAEEVLSVLAQDRRPNQLVFAKEMPWEQPAAPETVRLGSRYQLAHSEYDDSVKWTAPLLRQGVTYGDLPPWNQALPVDPTAGTWRPLILESTDLFHAPPPPANSSAQTMHEMEEIVAALNNRSCYTDFIVFKWANEQPGRWAAEIMDGLMSRYDWDAPKTARAEAILYAAMYDSLLTTWHEKFRYLRPRPALLETGLPTVILTPKHPSYPAGHGTYVGAGFAVLQEFFPDERSEYEYLIPEVNNARVWAGVHFRDDMIAGNIIGEQVANAVIEKVHLDGSPGERSKRVLGQPLVTSAFFGDGGPKYH